MQHTADGIRSGIYGEPNQIDLIKLLDFDG